MIVRQMREILRKIPDDFMRGILTQVYGIPGGPSAVARSKFWCAQFSFDFGRPMGECGPLCAGLGNLWAFPGPDPKA